MSKKQFGRDSEGESGHNPVYVNDLSGDVPMKPWMQRILIGTVVAVTAGGIAAWSNLVVQNNATANRIEAKLEDVSRDFDNFTNIRYQDDLTDTRTRIANVEERLDRVATQP